jgi:hypothetical protein
MIHVQIAYFLGSVDWLHPVHRCLVGDVVFGMADANKGRSALFVPFGGTCLS